VRVAGTDPGTSSLDVVVLEDGRPIAERRWTPDEVAASPGEVLSFLEANGPLACVAAPSGYGMPLRKVQEASEYELALATLVRRDDPRRVRGVPGLSRLLRSLAQSKLPAVFLPGGIHLPTIPRRRKVNRIDLGTADKICLVALALYQLAAERSSALRDLHFLLVEVGSAFSAVLAVAGGKVVDALGGTSGPVGLRSAGALDGEVAYLLSPLTKDDLFSGGVGRAPDDEGREELAESLAKAVGALATIAPVDTVVLSGEGLRDERLQEKVEARLAAQLPVTPLNALPGASLKQAAQGAALIADGLAGGRHANLVEHLELEAASGDVLDYLRHPSLDGIRELFEG
jgi:predicted butyrate kinase (DUF1464 family)